MKKLLVIGLAMMVVAIGSGKLALAAEEGGAGNAVQVTVKGVNYCIETALKKGGPAPKLTPCACRHALKVVEATGADGKAIDEMKDWTLHYLYSESSVALSTDKACFDKNVTVKGTVYRSERVIEVESVEVEKDEAAAPAAQAAPQGDVAQEAPAAKKDDDLSLGDKNEFAEFDYGKGGGSASTQKKK